MLSPEDYSAKFAAAFAPTQEGVGLFALFLGTLNPAGCRIDVRHHVDLVECAADPGSYSIGLSESAPESLSVSVEVSGLLCYHVTPMVDVQGDRVTVRFLRRLDGTPYLNGPVPVCIRMLTGVPIVGASVPGSDEP